MSGAEVSGCGVATGGHGCGCDGIGYACGCAFANDSVDATAATDCAAETGCVFVIGFASSNGSAFAKNSVSARNCASVSAKGCGGGIGTASGCVDENGFDCLACPHLACPYRLSPRRFWRPRLRFRRQAPAELRLALQLQEQPLVH